MPDTLTTITNLINSPPGQLLAGATLAGIVWKLFERVDVLLTDNTKFEIAVWLVGVKAVPKDDWPETFSKLFDRAFGQKHLSWRCLSRSAVATFATLAVCVAITWLLHGNLTVTVTRLQTVFPFHREEISVPVWTHVFAYYTLLLNVPSDYFTLLLTRRLLGVASKHTSAWKRLALLALALYVTAVIASITTYVGQSWVEGFAGKLYAPALDEGPIQVQTGGSIIWPSDLWNVIKNPLPNTYDLLAFWYVPAFFTSIWLWLYAGSGFLLKAARRFDIGFQWFNRSFDIEKKPLSAIGLVAGVLVAIVYWAAAIVVRFG